MRRCGASRRPWTEQEEATLLALAGSVPYAAIAEQLGRTYKSVKSRANLRSLKTRTLWTEAQRARLAEAYRKVPAKQLARELGKSLSSVYKTAQELGLARAKFRWSRSAERKVRRLHGLGWSDAEIADEVGCERHTVGDWRERVGLPSNALSEHRRRRVSAKTAEQCKAAGLTSLAEIRSKAFRRYARASGWPEDLRPRAVQVLNALASGPKTRRQLADATGMPWKGSRKSLVSNDPEGSYLANLMARGLVVSLGRVVRGVGRGKSVQLYSLALTVERSHGSSQDVDQAGAGAGRGLAIPDASGADGVRDGRRCARDRAKPGGQG